MQSGILFHGGVILTGGARHDGLAVAVAGGRIAALGREAERLGRRRARGLERVDLEGAYLAPGFVDLHTHGAVGVQFDTADGPQLDEVAREHYLACGVTRLLASVCPAPRRALLATVRRLAAAIHGGRGAGVIAGLHMEGPFLSPRKPGALPARSFRTYDASYLDALLDAGEGLVRTMTVAPERSGGLELVRHLKRRRVAPAFGHSDGDIDDARAAVRAGTRYVTHLFNAMNGIHHRAPGPVSAFLDDDRIRVELISDGHHVDVAVMRWLAAVKSAETICLVSDSVGPCGLRPGRYEFAGSSVTLEGGRVTLADGTLAGSALTMDEAFRVQVRRVGLPPERVAVSASATPARIAGWSRSLGSIEKGRAADLVVLSPSLRVDATYLGGARVFKRR